MDYMEFSNLEWLYIIGMWLMAATCGLIALFHTPKRKGK